MIFYHTFIVDPQTLHWGWECHWCKPILSKVFSFSIGHSESFFLWPRMWPGSPQPGVMSARDNGNDQWWEQHCIQMRSIKHKLIPSLLLFASLLPIKPCDWLLLFILSWTWLLLVTGSLVMIWAMGHWPHWWHHVWCDQAEQIRPWGHCGSDSNCSNAGLVGKRDNPANAKYFTISTCDLSPL